MIANIKTRKLTGAYPMNSSMTVTRQKRVIRL